MAGFLSAQFAYGHIGVFRKFLEHLFSITGNSLSHYVVEGSFSSFEGLYYRFQKFDHIVYLFGVLKRILERFGSMGSMVRSFYEGDIRRMIWRIRDEFIENDNRLTFFFPKPSNSNPMKRWNLYLRWMVRKDEIDVGLWDFIPKDRLTVPLDTHIFKIGRCFGWTTQKNPSWKAACDITNALKTFSPDDPLQFDFFLCQSVGIHGKCTGMRTSDCIGHCVLLQKG